MDNGTYDLDKAKEWDEREIISIKAKIFDLMRSWELLQFSMNKINKQKTELIKKLEGLEKPVTKPVKEGE